MKFVFMTAALFATGILTVAPAAPAFAQTAHQHTETTPPVAGSPATPASPGTPSSMMQTMPPEMMQMMQMMRKMHSGALPRTALMGGSPMMPGGIIQNVEGHIAFLKAELKITDAQQKSWDQFAEALRTNAKTLEGALTTMMKGMMEGTDKKDSLAARLEQEEKVLALQLEGHKRSRAALEALTAALSEEQSRQLNELM
jgi:hypothetical protein